MDDEEDPEHFCSVVLVIDGFSHLRDMDHEPDEDDNKSQMLKLLHSETDDEAGNPASGPQIEEEKPEAAEPDMPTEWSCSICTLLNSMQQSTCDICG